MTNRAIGAAIIMLLSGLVVPVHAETEIHAIDFANGPDERWSSDRTHDLPADANKFLGRFTNDAVTLKLTDLPDHALIRVEFDLYLIRTWDGNKPKIGPDSWQLKTDDGRVWVDHTFANGPDDQAEVTQNFPGTLAGERSRPMTLAVGKNNIGGYDMSSTYRMRFTFPHRKKDVAFTFAGKGLQDVENECWGIDNVRVTVLQADDVPAADAKQLAAMIDKLRAEDPTIAWQAMLAAVAQGDRFTAHVQANLSEGLGASNAAAMRQRVDRWIMHLDDDSFQKREEATGQLIANLAIARPIMVAALERDNLSPEQRWRLQRALTSSKGAAVADPDQRLLLRMLRTLKLIDTDDARTLAEKIAGEHKTEDIDTP